MLVPWRMASMTRNTIYTGKDPDQKLLRSYMKWQDNDVVMCSNPIVGKNQPPMVMAWKSATASRVFGTDGTIFHRHVQSDEILSAFVSDVYREVGLVNTETVTYMGISLYRFKILRSLMMNATSNKFNKDFYSFGYDGLFNISLCSQGASVFISKPHFLDADPIVQTEIEGVSPPSIDEHDTYLDVEPITGFVMRAFKRMQVNVHIRPVNGTIFKYHWFANVRPTYLPVAWFEESGIIGDSQAHNFVSSVYAAQNFSKYLKLIGFIGGEVIVIFGLLLLIVGWRSRQQQYPSYEGMEPLNSSVRPLE